MPIGGRIQSRPEQTKEATKAGIHIIRSGFTIRLAKDL
jgi:hypothetical protein